MILLFLGFTHSPLMQVQVERAGQVWMQGPEAPLCAGDRVVLQVLPPVAGRIWLQHDGTGNTHRTLYPLAPTDPVMGGPGQEIQMPASGVYLVKPPAGTEHFTLYIQPAAQENAVADAGPVVGVRFKGFSWEEAPQALLQGEAVRVDFSLEQVECG